MNKKNKLLVYLFCLGLITVLTGAYLKINRNSNAVILLIAGILLEVIAVIGLLINNFKKIKNRLN